MAMDPAEDGTLILLRNGESTRDAARSSTSLRDLLGPAGMRIAAGAPDLVRHRQPQG
jgi:hypothetical protein